MSQVQFALERGVPALIGVMASIRLPYPSRAFDMAHCSRCLLPWGQYGNLIILFVHFHVTLNVFDFPSYSFFEHGHGADGVYLIEVGQVLRPGGQRKI